MIKKIFLLIILVLLHLSSTQDTSTELCSEDSLQMFINFDNGQLTGTKVNDASYENNNLIITSPGVTLDSTGKCSTSGKFLESNYGKILASAELIPHFGQLKFILPLCHKFLHILPQIATYFASIMPVASRYRLCHLLCRQIRLKPILNTIIASC